MASLMGSKEKFLNFEFEMRVGFAVSELVGAMS